LCTSCRSLCAQRAAEAKPAVEMQQVVVVVVVVEMMTEVMTTC
jgi:hypothetical protein